MEKRSGADWPFENDVKAEGTKPRSSPAALHIRFENDVKAEGIKQTDFAGYWGKGLRMM